jgi:small subunit ribosomal protein S16
MALKIRLKQMGRTNYRVFRLVLTDSRTFRDGKSIECLGTYNPILVNEDEKLSVDAERIKHWLGLGAQMSEKAEALVKKAAPSVLREHTDIALAKRNKLRLKRKERRKTKAAA